VGHDALRIGSREQLWHNKGEAALIDKTTEFCSSQSHKSKKSRKLFTSS